jgi:hypothetical protein
MSNSRSKKTKITLTQLDIAISLLQVLGAISSMDFE